MGTGTDVGEKMFPDKRNQWMVVLIMCFKLIMFCWASLAM